MDAAQKAQEAIAAVAGHEDIEPVGFRERYVAWASGRRDEAAGFIVGSIITSDPIGYTLFDLHAMEDKGCDFRDKVLRAKQWCWTEAARFVASRRHQGRIACYRIDWGRQAGEDGLCEALWGHIRGTGLAARAAQFGIGERPYQRVRDHVRKSAASLLLEFEMNLAAANGLDLRGTMK